MIKGIMITGICAVMLLGSETNAQTSVKTKVLKNGVEVPEKWPSDRSRELTRKAMPVPYLEKRQRIIPVNVGRQLFVDDYLIESTSLTATSHTPEYRKHPVLEPDKEWEVNGAGPYAAPFSDGIWYDEKEKKYKMWYLAGAPNKGRQSFYTCYAESDDGVNWRKPNLGIYGNTNVVDTFDRDAATVWLDKLETDPSKRYKMFNIEKRSTDNRWQVILKYSEDGMRWSNGVAQSGDMYDRTTAFYNPFADKWVLSMRYNAKIGRARSYLEHKSPEMVVSLAHRVRKDAEDANIVYWFGADDKEPRHPKFPHIEPQIYNHDAMPYESLMLGYYSVWEGPENDVCDSLGIQKRNEVLIGYSRDGFHWSRPSHKPFMGVNETEGAWNWGNVQSIGGVPIIKGDSLYFYVSGRRLYPKMWDAYTSTGLATLRRDGFVSMHTANDGQLTTHKIVFNGDYFFVNADVKGELRVELQDANGKPIPGYTRQDCIPMKGNSTRHLISWKNNKTTSLLKNQIVKAKFYLSGGNLYSFWVSPWNTGESRGYTSGGGPGLHPSGIDIK